MTTPLFKQMFYSFFRIERPVRHSKKFVPPALPDSLEMLGENEID